MPTLPNGVGLPLADIIHSVQKQANFSHRKAVMAEYNFRHTTNNYIFVNGDYNIIELFG